jgi:hypothetical protein
MAPLSSRWNLFAAAATGVETLSAAGSQYIHSSYEAHKDLPPALKDLKIGNLYTTAAARRVRSRC